MSSSTRKTLTWLLTLLVVGVGVWYIQQKVNLAVLRQVLMTTRVVYLCLSVGVMVTTLLLKAWRWQLLLVARPPVLPFATLFWAMMLGQYVNLVMPFLRLGEIARTFALDQQTNSGKLRTLSTVGVEKVADLLFLLLTWAGLLPFMVLPDVVQRAGWVMVGAIGTAVILFSLFLWQKQQLLSRLHQQLVPFITAGLEGLTALQNRRLMLGVGVLSAMIALLAIFTPYFLFLALHLPLGLGQAAFLHLVVTVVSTPPSTPIKIGVFNATTAFVLYQLGVQDDTAVITYSLLFHLVVVVPQLLLGGLAVVQTGWHFQS